MIIRVLLAILAVTTLSLPAFAQGYKTELETPEKVSIAIKNLDGKVSVIASEQQQKKVSIDASSTGAPVTTDDVKVDPHRNAILHQRAREPDRDNVVETKRGGRRFGEIEQLRRGRRAA